MKERKENWVTFFFNLPCVFFFCKFVSSRLHFSTSTYFFFFLIHKTSLHLKDTVVIL